MQHYSMEPGLNQTATAAERAIAVRLVLPGERAEEVEESLEELGRLAWTAGAQLECTVVQRRQRPCPATLIGAGKVRELAAAVEELEANLVLFDSDLTPAQGSNLQDTLGVKVIDRTQLILDIFAQRAKTLEGKHQVELAQLQYTLPRLRGKGIEMMRQIGGIGVRGPGEQKLEVDRRVIRERIQRLTRELEEIRKHRRLQRKRRAETGAARAALVGYTNAGKSTLLNALTAGGAFVEDKLFATLDPVTRRATLPSGRECVLTDTVGFIRRLPHSLVAAFRATLEEVNEADLLLVVADASSDAVEEQISSVHDVLEEIGATNKPLLYVFNKTDRAVSEDVLRLQGRFPNCIAVSALRGDGLEGLREAIDRQTASGLVRVRLRIPQSAWEVVSEVHRAGRVLKETYENNEVLLEAELGETLRQRLKDYVA